VMVSTLTVGEPRRRRIGVLPYPGRRAIHTESAPPG
jgi:hypothetical protein